MSRTPNFKLNFCFLFSILFFTFIVSSDASLATNQVETITKKSIETEIDKAEELLQKKDWEQATRSYKKLLLYKKKDPVIWNNLGIAQQKMKQYKYAEKDYRYASMLDLKNPLPLYNLANLYIEEQNYDSAKKQLKDLVQNNPEFLDSYSSLAAIYIIEGKYFDAVETYKKALQYTKERASLYYNLGLLYHDLKKYDDMFDVFHRAIKIDPCFEPAYYSIALSYHRNLLEQKAPIREKNIKKSLMALKFLNPELAKELNEKHIKLEDFDKLIPLDKKIEGVKKEV